MNADDGLFQIVYRSICERINSSGPEKHSRTFSQLKSNCERVCYVLSFREITDLLTIRPSRTEKDLAKATAIKDEGNRLFKNHKYNDALVAYNKALSLMPPDDKQKLATCYANRSAVLFHLGLFEASQRDIDTALESGYPSDLKYKLIIRKAKCALNTGTYPKDEVLKMAIDSLPYSLEKDSVKLITELSDYKPEKSAFNNTWKNPAPVVPSLNKQHPALSSLVKVSENNEYGRYIQAVSDISTGDTVLIEKPFCSVTLSDYYLTHCCHCQRRCDLTPYPCVKCANVVYCSLECRQTSWEKYHQYECYNIENLRLININMGHLALRAALNAGYPTLKQVSESPDFTNEYLNIYTLEGHENERCAKDLFWRSIAAVILAKMCDVALWSGETENGIVVLATSVLNHMQSFPCNAHEISEMLYDTKEPYKSQLVEIGAGIYSTLSYFNHSCDPTVVRTFYSGNTCVVKALCPANKYEQVFDNYGCLYAVHTLEERQKKLSCQYMFECCCVACLQNWPLYSQLSYDLEPVYKCSYCSSMLISNTCDNCGKPFDKLSTATTLTEAKSVFDKQLSVLFTEDISDNQLDSVLKKLAAFSDLTNKIVFRPFKCLNDCQEALKHVYNMLGNRTSTTQTSTQDAS